MSRAESRWPATNGARGPLPGPLAGGAGADGPMSLSFLVALGLLGVYLMLRGRARSQAANADPDLATLAELARAGSDLAQLHEIEFFLYLPTQRAAEEVAAQLQSEGFTVKVESGETAGDWLCLATRQMNPTLDELQRLRRHLSAVAESRDGAYDGWGATVVEPEDTR